MSTGQMPATNWTENLEVLSPLELSQFEGSSATATGPPWDLRRSSVSLLVIVIFAWTPLFLAWHVLLSLASEAKLRMVQGSGGGGGADRPRLQRETAAKLALVLGVCVWLGLTALLFWRSEYGSLAMLQLLAAVASTNGSARLRAVGLCVVLVSSGLPCELRDLASAAFGSWYEDVIAGHGVFCVAFVGHSMLRFLWLACTMVISFCVDHLPSLRGTKIQEQALPPTYHTYAWLFVESSWHILAQSFLGATTADCCNYELHWEDFVSCEEMVPRMFVTLVIADTWIYWVHYNFHRHPFLYKAAHKVHHSFPAPFAAMNEHAHDVDDCITGASVFVTMMLVGRHMLFFYATFMLELAIGCDMHLGNTAPCFPFRYILPGYGEPDFHDFHHRCSQGNYAAWFTWWDACIGTDATYKEFKGKQFAKSAK